MKLYKGDKIMQMVDKDQVDICLDSGWSKKAPEAEKEEVKEAGELKEEAEGVEKVEAKTAPVQKKILKAVKKK